MKKINPKKKLKKMKGKNVNIFFSKKGKMKEKGEGGNVGLGSKNCDKIVEKIVEKRLTNGEKRK